MRINVDRPYDDGNLKGSMIGVIVGVVLAVVLLIIAVALLVFAKATSRWCFADDYDNPSNAKSHPRSAGGGRPANQQAQVYRFYFLIHFELFPAAVVLTLLYLTDGQSSTLWGLIISIRICIRYGPQSRALSIPKKN